MISKSTVKKFSAAVCLVLGILMFIYAAHNSVSLFIPFAAGALLGIFVDLVWNNK